MGRGGLVFLDHLAVIFDHPRAAFRTHQLGEGVNRGVQAIGGIAVAGICAHLVFERGEGADVMHSKLLVQGGNRLGAKHLPAPCGHAAIGNIWIDGADCRGHHIAALIRLGDNPVRPIAVK